MKGDKWVRLGPEEQKAVLDYQALFKFKTRREALKQLIGETVRTRAYLQYVLDHREASKEEPECLRRIGPFMGSFWCAVHAPRVVELELGLDICRACKSKVIMQVLKPQMEAPPPVSNGNIETQDTRTKKTAVKQIYCRPQGGLWVTARACAVCRDPCGNRLT